MPSLVGCYNPLLPSKFVGGGGGGSSATKSPKLGKVGATVGFSTSGPKLPSAPKPLMDSTSTLNVLPVFADAQSGMLFKGKKIQVDYGLGEASDSEGDEDHESDDEYHV